MDEERRRQKEAEAEAGKKKLPYPKSVFFIVGNEFCERFSYYGMRAVLAIYIKSKLHFNEDTATAIYHGFAMLCYFTPIFGALIADQLLGKYRTIVYISMIYVLGHVLKTLASVPPVGLPPVEFSLLGLLLIAFGTGGIKPCVSAFGGDQFKLPEQERQLQTFFSVFYFAINAGSLISTFITPIFRQDIGCFGDDTCYALAFGVPAVLMAVATVILIAGRSMYNIMPPQGNIMTKVFGSIYLALKKKFSGAAPKEHWLDHAKDKYEVTLVEDVKCLLRVLVLYLPLPVFWALYDQQGSRWTFQATRMNGQMGGYILKPDQIQLVNPAFILILIPLFDMVIYPAFAKINLLKKPLQRLTVGGILTAIAFFVSGILELKLMSTYAVVPQSGESHLHLMNSLPCPVEVKLHNASGIYSNIVDIEARVNNIVYELSPGRYDVEATIPTNCPGMATYSKKLSWEAKDEAVSGLLIRSVNQGELALTTMEHHEEPEKEDDGSPKLRVIFDTGVSVAQNLTVRAQGDGDRVFGLQGHTVEGTDLVESKYIKVAPGSFDVYAEKSKVGELHLTQGGVHILVVTGQANLGFEQEMLQYTLTQPNTIHMLWLLPQYFIITTGEILFSVSGLEFSYSQAPESMKSVLQAFWLLTVSFGNLIVLIIAEAKAFNEQASEFFMFGVLMVVDMVVFAIMAYRYKPIDWAKRKRDEAPGNNNGVANESYREETDF